MQQIPNAGNYTGSINGPIVIYETAAGALCAAIPVKIPDVAWSGKHTICIVKKDGTVQTRSVQTLKEVFGWDGLDPFWLTEQDFGETTFELVCIHESYVPENSETGQEVTSFKIQWMNPAGGSSRMPEAADRKAVLAKYGSKFRALSGTPASKPAAKATPPPADDKKEPEAPAKAKTPPTRKAAPARTVAGQAPTATLDEAWQQLVSAKPGLSEAEVGEIWYAEIAKAFPGKENSDLTIQEWGALRATFAAMQ